MIVRRAYQVAEHRRRAFLAGPPRMAVKRRRLPRWAVVATWAAVLAGLPLAGAAWALTRSVADVRVQQARVALACGQCEQGLDFARQVLAGRPADFEALCIEAEALMGLGRSAEAARPLNALTAHWPQRSQPRKLWLRWAAEQLVQAERAAGDSTARQACLSRALTAADAQVRWLAGKPIGHRGRAELSGTAEAVQLRAAEAMLGHVDACFAAGRGDEAMAGLEALASCAAPARLRMGHDVLTRFVRLGRLGRAIAVAQAWAAEMPEADALHGWAGEVLALAGRADESAASYAAALAVRPGHAGWARGLALAHQTRCDWPAAEQAWEHLAGLGLGEHGEALAERARMYAALGLAAQARAVLDELADEPGALDATALLAAGQAAVLVGQDDLAGRLLDAMGPRASQFPAAQVLLARLACRRGDDRAGRRRVAALLESSAHRSAAVAELLRLNVLSEIDAALLAEADSLVRPADLDRPARGRWLRMRANLQAEQGDWPGVLATLDQLRRDGRADAQIEAARAAVLAQLGRGDEAPASLGQPNLDALLAVATGRPALSAEATELAGVLWEAARGRADQAAVRARRAEPRAAVFADDLAAMFSRGGGGCSEPALRRLALAELALRAGLPQLCAAVAEQVAADAPGCELACGLYVEAEMARGRSVPSGWAARRGLAEQSGLMDLLVAIERERAGQPTAAAEAIERLAAREGRNSHVLYIQARAFHAAGRLDETMAVLERLARLGGVYALAADNDLACLLAESAAPDLPRARRLAERALAGDPGNTAFQETLGWLDQLQGAPASAVTALNRCLPALAGVGEVHAHLAAAYAAAGNGRWADYHAAARAGRPPHAKPALARQY